MHFDREINCSWKKNKCVKSLGKNAEKFEKSLQPKKKKNHTIQSNPTTDCLSFRFILVFFFFF